MITRHATESPTHAASLDADVRETHTGIVVMAGDRAYKAKKALTTDFLDFSTPALREEACKREVELNSRLSAESYLGVAHLTDPAGGPPEPLVVMRRYPDASRLSTVVKRGSPVEAELAAVAEVVARFHEGADRGWHINAQAKISSVGARWQENIVELKRFAETVMPLEVIDQIERLANQYLSGRAVLFTQRIGDRRIVDGHGDLLAEDIFCLPDGPALLDCLEFDDHLRYVDCIDDVAFLAMDLEFLGRKDLADYFLSCYRRYSGDQAPASLVDFYIAYRAVVRAKVDGVRYTQGSLDAASDASRHLSLAIEHLTAATVRLTLIGGGPGTGKTTLARSLAERVGADDIRRELQQSTAISGEPGILDAGLYTAENVSAVYHEVIRRAHTRLANGQSVILDATWRDFRHRKLANELAAEARCAFLEIACAATVDAAAERVRRRPASNSDATPEIAEALAIADETWATAHRIDTSRGVAESTNEAEKLWRCTV
jgi:uncharacterized protein